MVKRLLIVAITMVGMTAKGTEQVELLNLTKHKNLVSISIVLERVSDDVVANVTFKNTSKKNLALPKYHLFFNELTNNYFLIMIKGKVVGEYKGKSVKRAAPTLKTSFVLNAGKSITRKIVLNDYYIFPMKNVILTVKYDNVYYENSKTSEPLKL